MKLDVNGELSQAYRDKLDAIFADRVATCRKYARYTGGDNPTILDKEDQEAPDNRVPVPFGRKIVSTVKGYFAKPGYITYKAEGDAYQEAIKGVFDENNEELLTAELVSDALGNVGGYEILRVSEDLKIKQYRADPETCLPVYDDTLDRKLIAFVHRVDNEDDEGEITTTQTIYYAGFFVEYQRTGSGEFAETGRKDHPFGDVPAVAYKFSADEKPIFYSVIPLIDEHDKIISSDYANEFERFANAYLLSLKKISSDVAAKAKALRIFDGLEDAGASGLNSASEALAFLTKPSRGSDISEGADRFERLIYEQAMVINPSDEGFGTPSGIALRYRLLPMEWLAADGEGRFSVGLQRRLTLIGNALTELNRVTPEPVTINFRRNIPVDSDSIIKTAGNAKGILSEKTILDMFPADIVPNKAEEMERLEEERSMALGSIELPDQATDVAQDAGTEGVAAGGEIQQTALNGAQIKSLVDVVVAVNAGTIEKASAVAIIKAAFPLIGDDVIAKIFAG